MLKIKDNVDLKSQLKGTTHCYDEEEHRQLKERISYLERSIVRKEETITELEQERVPYTNEYVSKVKKENEELKKQLEKWKHYLKYAKEMLDIQGMDGNYNYDDYMLGLYNGMEFIISLFETREPIYRNGKDTNFLHNDYKTQQQEFIKFLEDEIKACKAVSDLLFNHNKELKVYKENLARYKEIIGVSDERKN